MANPLPIQILHIPPGEKARGIYHNISLPIIGEAVFCKLWHMGRNCLLECPRRGSHVSPSAAIIYKVASAMSTAHAPLPETIGMGAVNGA